MLLPPPSGPDPADWLTAAFRGLHPVRWALSAAGLAVTVGLAAVARALLDGEPPDWAGWWSDPVGQAEAIGEAAGSRSLGGAIFRLGLVVAAAGAVWCLIGAWVARHELLARHAARSYTTSASPTPGPTGLVARQAKSLATCCPLVLAIAGLLVLPLLTAGVVTLLGGGGAILVAVLLPVVILADLFLLLIALGAVAWPLMPVTIAAENSDTFDALSRSYNYAYMRPVRFVLLTAAAVAVAGLPLLAGLALFADPWVLWPAAALSVSVFWSLETLVYLHLRTAIDAVAPDVLADGSKPEATETPTAKDKEEAAGTPAPTAPSRLGLNLAMCVVMVGTWYLTAWLFARAGGEEAGWIGWGMGGRLVPPAEGLYKVASLIAGVWALLAVGVPVVVAARGYLRPSGRPTAGTG